MTLENTLAKELEGFARLGGAALFGVADLEPAREFIAGEGNFPLDPFPRAVSLGCPSTT